jgi:thymidine kinase
MYYSKPLSCQTGVLSFFSFVKIIQERLIHLLKEKRKTFILAIDESQYLNHHILRDVKLLIEYLKMIVLIAFGEVHLSREVMVQL